MTTGLSISQLQKTIERHFSAGPAAIGDPAAMKAFLVLRAAIESGEVRAASPDPGQVTGWRVNAWVKQGILLGFRLGALEELAGGGLSFVDKNTYPVRHFDAGGWFPAARRCGPGLMWAGAWFACRPCTSMPGLMLTRERWWTHTRWLAPARRLVNAFT